MKSFSFICMTRWSSVTTYVKVLRGFERIHLEPGEEKVIDFVLTRKSWDYGIRIIIS